MAWKELKPSAVSEGGKKRGCYILKKLCEAWGCEPVNAVGSVGCFYCESTCDPAQYNKAEKNGSFKGSAANGTGYGAGLAQWSLGWKKDIQKMFHNFSPIEQWSMDQQVQIILKTCKPKFVNMLKGCKTATESTDIWLRGYENGGGGSGGLCKKTFINKYTWCNGYYGAMQHRTTAAIEILKAYTGGEVGADIAGDISNFQGYDSGGSSGGGYGGVMASGDNGVLSPASDNIYSNFVPKESEEEKAKHTRIYQAFPPGHKIDQMQYNVDGTVPTEDIEEAVTVSENTANSDTEPKPNDSKSIVTDESIMEAGVSYPVIRINDYYFHKETIKYFKVSTTDFVPTATLVFTTKDENLLKQDTIKDGDIMSVFMAPTSSMYKSMRCDFLITSFYTQEQSQQRAHATYTYTVYAELYVPNLYNANLTFAYSGSSRDAIMYAAEQLKLGFNFNDPENTDDAQMWYCTTECAEESPDNENRPSNVKEFIISTANHSWKNFESFYNVWIDPRYAITFLNVNKQLKEQGPDEPLDVIPWLSAIMQNRGTEGSRSAKNPEDEKSEASAGKGPVPQVKLFSNISDDDDHTTVMYVTDFKVVNQAGEISRQMGVNIQKSYIIDNHGVDNESNSVNMKYSIPYNDWKLQHGFYIQIGPGKNESYIPGDSFDDFVRTNTVKQGGMTTDMQADSDGATIEATGDNMEATGAVNKFYDAGAEHNRINNLQLQKKYVQFTLNGANFGIMRGEKIPAVIVDHNQLNQVMTTRDDAAEALMKSIYEEMSGWFIIDGIQWIYDPMSHTGNTNAASTWKTVVKCIRREWPISGNAIAPDAKDDANKNNPDNVIQTNPTGGSSVENKTEELVPEPTPEDPKAEPEDTASVGGLQPEMTQLFNMIRAAIPEVTMYQGRMWAANENKEKCEGLPYITDGGCYEFINTDGSWALTSTKKAVHFTGWAINIQHPSLKPNQLVTKIIYEQPEIIDFMYEHGLSSYIETHRSQMKAAWKTVHIGADTKMQGSFWELVMKIKGEDGRKYADFRAYNTAYIEPQRPNEITRSEVDAKKQA